MQEPNKMRREKSSNAEVVLERGHAMTTLNIMNVGRGVHHVKFRQHAWHRSDGRAKPREYKRAEVITAAHRAFGTSSVQCVGRGRMTCHQCPPLGSGTSGVSCRSMGAAWSRQVACSDKR